MGSVWKLVINMNILFVMRFIVLLVLIQVLSGCGVDYTKPENFLYSKLHNVIGSDGYFVNERINAALWDQNDFEPNQYEEIASIKIGKLRINQVRQYQLDDRFARTGFPNVNKNCSKISQENYQDHIELNGEINKDSALIIERILRGIKKCKNVDTGVTYETIVYMNSKGGYLSDGYKIGRVFKKYGVQAEIAGGQGCSSACAVAFLGAKYRVVSPNGSLLFHAPYLDLKDEGIKCSIRSKQKQLNNYYIEMIGKENGDIIFDRTMDYCDKNSGWEINSDAARIFGVTTREHQKYIPSFYCISERCKRHKNRKYL